MFPLNHILCISLTLPAKMFTKYGALLIPEHLASKRHVHQGSARDPQQILFSPYEDAAQIIQKQTAEGEERETIRHADFVTTHLNSPELLSPKQWPSTGVSHGSIWSAAKALWPQWKIGGWTESTKAWERTTGRLLLGNEKYQVYF